MSTTTANSILKLTVYWGDLLYDTLQIKAGESIRIGSDSKSKYVLSSISPIDIISMDEKGNTTLKFNEKMQGHIKVGNQLLSVAAAKENKAVIKDAQGQFSAPLQLGDKADLALGHMSFYFDWENTNRIFPRSDTELGKSLKRMAIPAGIFILLSLFLVFVQIAEEEPDPERIVEVIANPVVKQAKAALGEKQTDDGGAAKGDLGKAAMKTEAKPSQADALKNANLSSLVSGLTSMGSAGPKVAADAGVKSNMNQEGTGGFSAKGLAQGGGGTSMGIGRSVGHGLGGFEGTGRLGLSGNAALDEGTGHGTDAVTTGGGLDRSVIDNIIRKRQDRIRLCYERQLNYNPKLAGKVSVHFVIGKTGSVVESRIQEDTMRNADVKNCILAEVKDWNFPAPEGGTLVTVNYPFVFESSQR